MLDFCRFQHFWHAKWKIHPKCCGIQNTHLKFVCFPMFYTQWISEQAPAHHNVLNRQRHLMLLIISDREMFSISISSGFFPQIVVNFLLDVSWMVRFFSLLSTWLSWYSRVAWSKANKRNVSQKPSTPIHLVESHYIFGSVLVIRCEHESHFACEEQRKREKDKGKETETRSPVLWQQHRTKNSWL